MEKNEQGSRFLAARKASGMSRERAADVAGVSAKTLYTREEIAAGDYRLSELRNLCDAMPDTAATLMADATLRYISRGRITLNAIK